MPAILTVTQSINRPQWFILDYRIIQIIHLGIVLNQGSPLELIRSLSKVTFKRYKSSLNRFNRTDESLTTFNDLDALEEESSTVLIDSL